MAVERLQRALARAGLGSRRSSEELIAAGVVKVNGRVATLGDKVDLERRRRRSCGARPSTSTPTRGTLALHKPAGVVTTMRDTAGPPRHPLSSCRPTSPGVFPVGRLDRDSEGLLLLTNDGDLAEALTHPRYGIEKEYLVEVEGAPAAEQLARAAPGCRARRRPGARTIGADRRRARRAARSSRVVMTEGRKREVRTAAGRRSSLPVRACSASGSAR